MSKLICTAAWGLLVTFTAATAAHAASLVPDVNFGGGDGWRAPFEVLAGDAVGSDSISPGLYNYLGNAFDNTGVNGGNLERGLAYNPTTGNLILVSRNNQGNTLNSILILNATTGVDVGALNLGSGVITGGNFLYNMAGVGDDGAIYVANLATNTTVSPFKVYRWANETAIPSVAFTGMGATSPLDGTRLGDSFDVIGSGSSTRFVAGYNNTGPPPTLSNSFATFSTADGTSFTSTHVNLNAAPAPVPPNGNFRLGITFADSDTVIGKSDVNALSIVDVTSPTSGNVTTTFSTDGIGLKPIDFAMVQGKPIVAMIEAVNADDPPDGVQAVARARIFVYDLTDPTLPLAERKIGEATALTLAPPGSPGQFNNGNSTGQVKFGAINGNVAEIYAMSTNNGIQKFILTLDLPAADNANFNGDTAVDGADFLIWQAGFGAAGTGTLATGDANADTNVDDADFDVWTAQFGDTGLASANAAAVPEPAGAALALAALAGLAVRRR